jgi:hypothetical protein
LHLQDPGVMEDMGFQDHEPTLAAPPGTYEYIPNHLFHPPERARRQLDFEPGGCQRGCQRG